MPPIVSGWQPPPLFIQQQSDFYSRIRAHYHWPDQASNTYQYFKPVFEFSRDKGRNWTQLSYREASDFNNCRILRSKIDAREIWINVRHSGTIEHNVLARVRITEPAIGDGDLVDLCSLNNAARRGSTYDRRLMDRTAAWFVALDLIAPIPMGSWQSRQHFTTSWQAIRTTSAIAGFWSVWIALLSQYLMECRVDEVRVSPAVAGTPGTQGSLTLAHLLYLSPDSSTHYPGTNITNITL